MMETRKARSPWIGFAIGVLAFALPLAGYFAYRGLVSRQRAKPAPAVTQTPESDLTPPVNPTFKIDESVLTPSGMSLIDPGRPVDPAEVRNALRLAEGWLHSFSVDPYSSTGSDSIQVFAIEVDCWHRLWAAESDPTHKKVLDAAVRERLQRFLQPERITTMLRTQGSLQGVLEILLLMSCCRDHGIDPAPLIPLIQSISPAIRSEMDRYPPSMAALFAWVLGKLGIDLERPLAGYRSSGLLFLQPREVEMSAGDVSGLAQEIRAFTDDGSRRFDDMIPDEKRYLERVLPYFAMSYVLVGKMELAGDLLTCLNCAGLADTYGYRDTLRAMIARQNRDGSFSVSPDGTEPRSQRLAPTASCLGALCLERRRSEGGL
jgi:hypothetical protein